MQAIEWKSALKDVLEKNIREEYRDKINEYIDFLSMLIDKWWYGDENKREKYAYHFALLLAVSDRFNTVRAKINSFYAYLVYRGYVSAYRLMKDKCVAGGESIYTWLRMYRDLLD
jgi:hypothetical protein